LVFLSVLTITWFGLSLQRVHWFPTKIELKYLFLISFLYLCSHVFRAGRLSIFVLDERHKTLELLSAHALTAFPSALLPFKIGEVFRLFSFFYVFKWKQKAFAIWIAERFCDILIVTLIIVGSYFFKINLPNSLFFIFISFLSVILFSLFGFMGFTGVFVYLKRYLILTSLSDRGLVLLRISHFLRNLELEILKAFQGRFSAVFFFSVLIWVLEVLALLLFIRHATFIDRSPTELFAEGLRASLLGNTSTDISFGFYQSLILAVITLFLLIGISLVHFLQFDKKH
jgi:hypothetical protein